MSAIGVQEQSGEALASVGLATFIRSHPLVAFFTIAFAGIWILFTPILLSGRGLGLIPLSDAVGLILFVIAPYLAALITTRILDEKTSVRD